MNFIYLALGWTFGVLTLVIGLLTLTESLLGGLALVAISMFWIPPVKNLFHSKTNIELSPKARGSIILALFVACGYFVSTDSLKDAEERAALAEEEAIEEAAAQRQANIDYFNQNTSQILGEIEGLIEDGDYDQAIAVSSKYLRANDENLDRLNKLARQAKEEAERKAQTEQILAKLKTIPESQYAQNRNLYQQLVANNPDNESYKEKLDYYSSKLDEQREKARAERKKDEQERAARLAMFGEPPKQSAWDGSYYEVERYLKKVANDPDSIDIDECTGVYQTEKGWLVGCDYRGRNAFGALIRQSNWFTIVHGNVVEMHDASAYRP
jgi:hypothetical protein